MLACHEQGEDGWLCSRMRWITEPQLRDSLVTESYITPCTVCKFQVPRCIGPIIGGQGKGRCL